MSMSEKIASYPPQSAYFIDTNDKRIDVVDSENQSIRVSVTGGSTDSASFDAFGRQRTSSPFTLFDTKSRYYDHQEFSTYASSGAAAEYIQNESSYNLSVGVSSGQKVIRESRKVFPYQPGKSLLIMNSFKFSSKKLGLRQRIGYFNSYNGFFLELGEMDLSLVQRSFSSGFVVETKIKQEDWNIDKMDGTGPSGITLDISKAQILWMDIEWLGVGSVRTGFIINGKFILCHTFHHANIIESVYMTTANLPIRFEIENIGASQSSSVAKQICSTVISEGGYDLKSDLFFSTVGGNTSTEMKSLSTAGVIYPLITIKLNSSRPDAIIVPAQIDLIVNTSDNLRYYLIKNGTLIGSNFISDGHGSVDVDTSSTGIAEGQIVQQGFLYQKTTIGLFGKDNFNYQLSRALASESTYTTETLTLAVSSFSPSVKVAAILGWYELT